MMAAVDKSSTILPKVDKPDEAAFHAREDAEKALLEAVRAKMTDLTAKLADRQGGRQEFTRQRDEVRARVDALSAQTLKLEEQRKALMEQMDDKQKAGRAMRDQVQNLKKTLGFKSEAEIDRRIHDIEDMMMSSSLTLTEEKKKIAEIQLLNKNRPLVGKYAAMEASAGNQDQVLQPLKVRLDETRDELKRIRDARRDEQEKLRALVAERQKAVEPTQDIWEERETLKRQGASHYQTIREVRDLFHQQRLQHNAYLAQQRTLRNEQRKEETKRRQLEGERRNLEFELEDIDQPAMSEEMMLLTQTIRYVSSLLPSAAETVVEAAAPAVKTDGVKGEIVMPKHTREEEFFYAPTRGKKARKNKAAAKKTTTAISHSLPVIADFARLKVDAPLDLASAETCLKQLEAKLEPKTKKLEELAKNSKARKAKLVAQLAALDKKTQGEETPENTTTADGEDE